MTLADFGDVVHLESLFELGRKYPMSPLSTSIEPAASIDVHERFTFDAAWSKLSFVAKEDLLRDQLEAPPFGRRLLVSPEDLTMIVESSGSSGMLKEVHALSHEDEMTTVNMIVRLMRELGLTSQDVVALTLPIGTAGGGAKIFLALRELGACTLRIGSLSTEHKADQIVRYGATAVIGTPSYLDRLATVIEEAGHDPAGLPVDKLLVATQAMGDSWITAIEDRWGAKLFEWYGNAAGFFLMSCGEGVMTSGGRRGSLHGNPAYQLLEVITESDTPACDGDRGQLVGTHLANSTAPLVRYASGDEGRFVASGRCPCGSPLPGLEAGTITRLDKMLKVKGVSLWPGKVDAALLGHSEIETFWVLLSTDPDGREVVTIFIRPSSGDQCDLMEIQREMTELTGIQMMLRIWSNPEAPLHFEDVSTSGKMAQWMDNRHVASSLQNHPSHQVKNIYRGEANE